MSRRLALLLCAFAAGCAASARPALHDPGEPTKEQFAQLRAAEAAYRKNDPGFAELRDELVSDPVTAFWLARMFVHDLLRARDARVLATDQKHLNAPTRNNPGDDFEAALREGRDAANVELFLRAAKGDRDPVETRALEQLDAMGAAAVPCLVADLARHEQAWVRLLGVELLARLHEVAAPAIAELAASAAERDRRTAAQVYGAMPPGPEPLAALQRLAADREFGVRGAAMRALEHGGPTATPLLLRGIADDDAFVRRSAAQALAGHPEPAAAAALVDYLDRCKAEQDARGVDAAQTALQALAKTNGPRTAEAWRRWVASRPPELAGGGERAR